MISALSVQRKKELRALHAKKFRWRKGRFLVEGVKPVSEALAADYPLETVFITPTLLSEAPQLSAALGRFTGELLELRSADIRQISTLKNPEGIVAVAKMPEQTDFSLARDRVPAVYLHRVNDPGNLGTVLRTALWFGIRHVILSPGSVDVYGPKVVRSSMGALFQLLVAADIDADQLMAAVQAANRMVICADMSGTDLSNVSIDRQWVLVLGSESHGVPQALLDQADRTVAIGRFGVGESLNLGVSSGIIMHVLMKKQKG